MIHFSPRQPKSEVNKEQSSMSTQTPANDTSFSLNAPLNQRILQMQRQLGNQRVIQMLESDTRTSSTAQTMLIQKKDLDYNEPKQSTVYKDLEKHNNKRIVVEIPQTELENYTFASVLSKQKEIKIKKKLPEEFDQTLDTGLNTLTIRKFNNNPSRKGESLAITIEIKHPRDFTERGDLSNTMQFGTEFTFTNANMIAEAKKKGDGSVALEESIAKKNDWKDEVSRIIDEPHNVTTSKNQYAEEEDVYKYTFEDGWWFQINLDPGVIEIQMQPMTLQKAESEKITNRVNKYIFGIAQQLGLHSDASFGGGHIHLDADSTFGGNELLFRNFIVDFENESAALEAFEHDPVNAPRVAQKSKEAREQFAKVIHEFDRDNREIGQEAIKSLAKVIEDQVYKRYSEDDPKYNALNYRHMLKEDGLNTLEIRAMRSQRTFQEFIMEAKLFMKRIEYLEKEIAVKNKAAEQPKFDVKKEITDSEVALESETKVFQALTKYCTQLGIDPEPYLKMAAEYREELMKTFKRDKMDQ
ncbi:hypothetical protein ACHHV8_13035 [Paenibacillus sp. TAB 01]|uniref:hypothetical protein n=1 Tax=Paenibacillus sp. TAB 01 TaxID=3368988 RepID=UPI0037536E05